MFTLFTIFPAENADAATEVGLDLLVAMVIVLGIVAAAALIVMRSMQKMAERKHNRPTAREQIEQVKAGGGTAASRKAAAEVATRRAGRVSTDQLDEVRQLATLLDNKAERLELLLTDAEERIAELQQLIESIASIDRPKSDATGTDGHSVEHARTPPAPSQMADPLTRSVYELADEGYTSVEIAQRLDEQVGKIDLILALRR